MKPADLDGIVTAAARTALQSEAVRLEDNFFALGGSSMAAINMTILLSDYLARELSVELIYEHPDLAKLSRHIGRLLAA